MIVVKVEHWPHGKQELAESLGTLHIANVGGSAELGHYECVLRAGDPIPWRVLQEGECEHRRMRPVWDLVCKALTALGYARS